MLRTTFAFATLLLRFPLSRRQDLFVSSQAQKGTGPRRRHVGVDAGQFNFLRGFYMGVPPTLEGKIPRTGAFLFVHQGDKGGVIVWTLGSLACQPTTVPPAFVAAMKASATGILEADRNEL